MSMSAVDDTVCCHQQSMALLAHPVATLHAHTRRARFTQSSDAQLRWWIQTWFVTGIENPVVLSKHHDL